MIEPINMYFKEFVVEVVSVQQNYTYSYSSSSSLSIRLYFLTQVLLQLLLHFSIVAKQDI